MYFPLRNACARMMATPARDDDLGARLYSLAVRNQVAPGIDQLGTVRAISAETGQTVWQQDQRAMTMSLVATGGGLVFGGDANGRFRAHDHETGEVVWEISLGSPVTGIPMTYAVDGRQYLAVSTGVAGMSGGLLLLTPELRPSLGNNLFVFALPQHPIAFRAGPHSCRIDHKLLMPADVTERATSSSTVSRRFVTLSTGRLQAFLGRPLAELDVRVVCIDGKVFRDHCMAIALGIDTQGRNTCWASAKAPIRWSSASMENREERGEA